MENDKLECKKLLEQTVNNFLGGTLSDLDKYIIDLLKEIIVVEKETASPDILFNMLKENYFETEEATINFINKLYQFEITAMNTYLDIYLEQVYNRELTSTNIDNCISNMKDLLSKINPDFVKIFEQKYTKLNIENEL